MEEKKKPHCPNCSQFYQLKLLSPRPKGNLPLFLSCGHSMCETCISQLIKFSEPIECKICHRDIELNQSDNLKNALIKDSDHIYEIFPINIYMLGEIVVNMMEKKNANKTVEPYIDLKKIIKNIDNPQGKCFECQIPTSKMCHQCQTVLCESCFNKSHRNFIVFKIHVLQDIESNLVPSTCKIHNKELGYYCKDCLKAICMDCMMVSGEKSCKSHNIESLLNMTETFVNGLSEMIPVVDETYRRLTSTAVDIGNLLFKIDNNTGSTSEMSQIIVNINHHFSKLMSIIQKHKQEIMDNLGNLKHFEKQSLIKSKEDVENAIKKCLKIMNGVKFVLGPNEPNKSNLYDLFEDAKQILKTPWYLSHDHSDDPLKVAVDEDICSLMSDYIHLEGNARSSYKLKSSAELEGVEIPPPPPVPVLPPELPKDVRLQNKMKPENAPKQPELKSQQLMKPSSFITEVPKYYTKAESMSSLDSIESTTSTFRNSKNYENYQKPIVQPVTPFESHHPQQLIQGSTERIYISHIVDPHNFYIQRACYQDMVKELIREFRNAASLPKPSINHVTEGKLYLAYNRADEMWERCRIVSIDKTKPTNPVYTVFCIDFGSTEVLTIDKLRLIPPARVQSPEPLAINASLANCEPITGAWSSDDAILIQNITDNKQAAVYVRRVIATSNYTVKLECDVTTYEDGISLAHALVFHERAKMPNPKQQYSRIFGPADKPKIFVNNNGFKYRTSAEVHITHIVSPDKFFVRKVHLQEVYEKMCDELDQLYSVSVNAGSVYLPEIGSVYVAWVEELGAWSRGVVESLPGRAAAALFLPDLGATIVLHWTKLRKIHDKFTKLQALAAECHLSGVTPLNKKWSVASVAYLKNFQDKVLELQVEETKNLKSIGVILYDKSDMDDVKCINTEMIKYRFAVSFGLFNFKKPTAVEEQPLTNKTPPKEVQPKPNPKKITILSRSSKTSPKKRTEDEDLHAKDKGLLRLEAKVLQCLSPSLLYISVVSLQKTCNELYEKIQKHYTKKPGEPRDDWQVGDRCCTLCSLSNTWRRAVIIEITNDMAKVFYTDFACCETLPLITLRELTPEFASIGNAAVKCHLSGIMPAVGDEWPSLTKEYLNELLDAYNRVFVTKCGNFKDQSMPIELWVYHTEQGGALEPDRSEWRSLNKKIIDQGLGVPDKTEKPHNTNAPAEDAENEILSFLNIQGLVKDWLKMEPLPLNPSSLSTLGKADSDVRSSINPSSLLTLGKADSDVRSSTTECGTDSEVAEPGGSNTLYISEWLPPEPFSSAEFNAIPTYIDNDGIIFLHEVKQQDTLDLIRKAFDVRFNVPDPKIKNEKWTVGELCCARFFLDNKFYRGVILNISKETSSCLIHYVDYGNEERCAFKDLRKDIVLHKIPVQAHKCVLSRILPVGGLWDRKTLDYIHKSIVEKQCFVRVMGPTVDGITPIDLKFDKLWINDHLVDFEMAIYTDGSKPVVAKFAPKYVETTSEEIDSGPEYIVEDETPSQDENPSQDETPSQASQASFDMKIFEGKNWSDLLEEEIQVKEKYLTFNKISEEEFMCNITIINNFETIELNVIHDKEEEELYDNMYTNLQEVALKLPPLNGVYKGKACAAIYKDDGLWYRAQLLQYSEENSTIKVKYVDFGNIDVIPLADAREITEDLLELPPATISAYLHGIQINKSIEKEVLIEKYAETFLKKESLKAKVINYDNPVPYVELRNLEDILLYQNLIEEGIFLKSQQT